MPIFSEITAKFMRWMQQQKFLLLNSLVVFLCFVFLPGVLIFRGVEAIAARQTENLNQKKRQNLHSYLNELATFSTNERFAHYLFYHCCRNSDGTRKSQKEMLRVKKRLKALFPGSFSFVIAGKNKEVQREISDEKSFLYLYKKVFAFISEVEEAAGQQKTEINELEDKLKRLRPFLGQLLREEDLFLPFKNRAAGSSILVSGSAEKCNLWYGSGKDFYLLVFISRDFIHGKKGMEFGARLLRRQNPDIILGFTPYPPEKATLNPALSEKDSSRVIRAIAEFEDLSFKDSTESRNFIATRLLNPTMRGFAFYKPGCNKDRFSQAFYSLTFRLLMALFLIGYVYYKRKPFRISVKLKIITFFSYAILLPLLVIGSLADQYLKQAEEDVVDKLKKNSQRTIEKIDENYLWYINQLEAKISQTLQDFGKKDFGAALQPKSVRDLHDRIHMLAGHDEFIMVDNLNQDYMKGISAKLMTNSSLIKTLCAGTVEAFLAPSAKILHKKRQYFSMIINSYKNNGKIAFLGASELDMNIYYKLLIEKSVKRGLFPLLVWKESTLNKNFIKARIKRFSQNEAKLAVYCRESEKTFFTDLPEDVSLQQLMKQAADFKEVQARKLRIAGKDYLALAMPGQNLKKLVISVLHPADLVSAEISRIKFKANFGGFILLILAASTFYLLRHLIFKPLDALKSGINSFSNRIFKNRLEVICENELGKLMHAFNNSFETLQDLEVARIVQESILPDPYLKAGSIEVLAKTMIASTLGGDYYDMIKLDEDRILVFLGDATGHGIPAALSMAMAKSVLIYESQQGIVQNQFMDQIHKLYHRLRTEGCRDFMTCICVEIAVKTGETTVINFGHPYPYLIKDNAGQAIQLSQLKGLPPGFGKNRKSCGQKICLNSGDFLILYTDGFVEAANRSGESLGFERFAEMIAGAREDELNRFMDKVVQKIAEWEPSAGDDRTMIIVRRA